MVTEGNRVCVCMCMYTCVCVCVSGLLVVLMYVGRKELFSLEFFFFFLASHFFRAVFTHFSWHCLGDFFEGGRKRLRVGLGEGAKS